MGFYQKAFLEESIRAVAAAAAAAAAAVVVVCSGNVRKSQLVLLCHIQIILPAEIGTKD